LNTNQFENLRISYETEQLKMYFILSSCLSAFKVINKPDASTMEVIIKFVGNMGRPLVVDIGIQ